MILTLNKMKNYKCQHCLPLLMSSCIDIFFFSEYLLMKPKNEYLLDFIFNFFFLAIIKQQC